MHSTVLLLYRVHSKATALYIISFLRLIFRNTQSVGAGIPLFFCSDESVAAAAAAVAFLIRHTNYTTGRLALWGALLYNVIVAKIQYQI